MRTAILRLYKAKIREQPLMTSRIFRCFLAPPSPYATGCHTRVIPPPPLLFRSNFFMIINLDRILFKKAKVIDNVLSTVMNIIKLLGSRMLLFQAVALQRKRKNISNTT